MVGCARDDVLAVNESQRPIRHPRNGSSLPPDPAPEFDPMKHLIPFLLLLSLAPNAVAVTFQDAQGTGPSPTKPRVNRVPITPAGSQTPGAPIGDISAHRVDSLPYVRRMDEIVSLDALLAEVDLTADPVLMIGSVPFTQADFRERALMYLGIADVEQNITSLITLAEITQRVAQGEDAADYLPSEEDVDRKIEEIKELVRMNAEQQSAQRGVQGEVGELGDKAVEEFLKSINSSVGYEKYREMLGAEAAFEKVFLPLPKVATNEVIWDLAKGPVPEDDPKPEWLPQITWNALAIDDSGKTLRQFVKGAGSRGEDIPAFFKGQVLTRIRVGVVKQLGVDYFFDHTGLPEGVFLRLGEHGVATAKQRVIDAEEWISGSKVVLEAARAADVEAQAALASASAGDDATEQQQAALVDAEVALIFAKNAVAQATRSHASAPADLKAARAAVSVAQSAVKDITTDELWHLVAGTLSDADHEIILRESLTLEGMRRTLNQAGRWLDDDAFDQAYADHQAVYEGTLFPLSAIIMFRGYSSLDRYREHYRFRESYRRWRRDSMDPDDVENHYREGGRLFFERGSVHVDMAYKGIANDPFDLASLNSAQATLMSAFANVGSMAGDTTMSFEDLLVQFPKPVVQNPQGNDRSFQRNPLRLRMTESDLSIFLTGYSLADDLFYHGSPGEYFGPYVQKCRRHAWGAELNAGAWIIRVENYTRSRPLAPLEGNNLSQADEDFLDLNYIYWSQECLRSLLGRVSVGG